MRTVDANATTSSVREGLLLVRGGDAPAQREYPALRSPVGVPIGKDVAVPLFRRKRDEQVDPNERSPQLGLKYKDLALLGQLMKAGANLDEPRHVLHFLYFPSRSPAEAAAETCRTAGYHCEVKDPLPEFPGQWSLVCERRDVVIDPITGRETTDFFDQLAATNGGEYDGWEAAA